MDPCRGLLADINRDLVSTFEAVRDNPDYLIRSLCHREIDVKSFERIRRWNPDDPLDRAVRLMYLNRTAFNGLFRVNRKGQFNVPFGCKKGTKLCDPVALRNASAKLKGVTLSCADFRDTFRLARNTDLIYVDPPYTVKHDNNGFRRYNERLFSWQDQLDLAALLNRLASQGARIVITNAAHREVRKLYDSSNFVCAEVFRSSRVAAEKAHRGPCKELVLVSMSIVESQTSRATAEIATI